MVGCRILCMALFASVYGYWIFVVCACHFLVMFVWMCWLRTKFCSNKCLEILFNVVIAAVQIFCFINVVEGHTRLRYLLYYAIVFSENIGLTFGWYIFAHTQDYWYVVPATSIIVCGFIVGIFFQILYYVFFHPNNYPPYNRRHRIRICVPLQELLHPKKEKSKPSQLQRQFSTEGQKRIESISKYHSDDQQNYV